MKLCSRKFAAIPKAFSLALAFGFSLLGFFAVTPSLVFAQWGAWSGGPLLPTPRQNLTSCVANGKIYVIGGNGIENGSSVTYSTVEVFDPSSNSWSTAPSMPTPRMFLTSSEVNGKIYAMGGLNFEKGGGFLGTVEVLDLSTNTWSTAPSMPTPRDGLTSCVVNGKIYAIGGEAADNQVFNTVEIFDPSTNSWSAGPSMPTERFYITSSVVNGKIYVIGGGDVKTNTTGGYSNTVEVFDPSTNSWSTAPSMPTRRFGLTSSVVNGKIYAIGGFNGTGYGGATANVDVYDPSINSWSVAPSMPTSDPYLTSSEINGKIYAIGGNDPELGRNDMYIFDPEAVGLVALDPFPKGITSSGTVDPSIDNILNDGLREVRGVVADSATRVILLSQYDGTVTFTLPTLNTDNGELFSLDGSSSSGTSLTVSPVMASDGKNYVAAVYRAPDGLGSNNGASSANFVILCADASNQALFSHNVSLTVVRPPVVLVHGMWSDPSVWDVGGFTKSLKAGGYTCYAANYSYDNASTFDPKSIPVPAGVQAIYPAVDRALNNARGQGLAATRVDVVAHSLGGLMTRSYSQRPAYYKPSNYNAGTIRRLVTLGTPHQGTPFGPLLWNNRYHTFSIKGDTIQFPALFTFAGMPIGTCHRDFQYPAPTGTGYANLTACSIPSHAIVGQWVPDGTPDYDAFASLLFLSFHVTPQDVFGSDWDKTDLIVPTFSAVGGLLSLNLFDTFPDVIHLSLLSNFRPTQSLMNDAAIQTRVMQLLASDDNENLFSSLPAPQIAAPIHQELPESIQHEVPLANGSIQITAPSSGIVVHGGDSVTITVTSQGTDQLQDVMVMIQSVGMDSLPTQLPASLTVKMPANLSLGSLSVLALARDVNGGLLADTLSISFQDTGVASGIQVIPDSLSLTPSSVTAALQVTGIFADGNFDITQGSSGTNYSTSSGGNGIIQVSANGVVTAVASGNDSIIVMNGANRSSIPVAVDLSTATVTSAPQKANFNSSIQAYPNPTSTSETLLYSLADESSVSITIYDALGRIVARPVMGEMESSGQHGASFDTQNLPPGLYSCRLSAGDAEMFAKMVVVR